MLKGNQFVIFFVNILQMLHIIDILQKMTKILLFQLCDNWINNLK